MLIGMDAVYYTINYAGYIYKYSRNKLSVIVHIPIVLKLHASVQWLFYFY